MDVGWDGWMDGSDKCGMGLMDGCGMVSMFELSLICDLWLDGIDGWMDGIDGWMWDGFNVQTEFYL